MSGFWGGDSLGKETMMSRWRMRLVEVDAYRYDGSVEFEMRGIPDWLTSLFRAGKAYTELPDKSRLPTGDDALRKLRRLVINDSIQVSCGDWVFLAPTGKPIVMGSEEFEWRYEPLDPEFVQCEHPDVGAEREVIMKRRLSESELDEFDLPTFPAGSQNDSTD